MNLPKHLRGPARNPAGRGFLARLTGRAPDARGLPGFSFWRLNILFWSAFALIAFAARWLVNIPPQQAFLLTIFNEGVAFFSAVILREIYRRSEITFGLRTAAKVVACSMIGAVVLAFFSFAFARLTGWVTPNLTDLESAALRFIFVWMALLGWSLGYFWIQTEQAWTEETRHVREAEHDAHRMELQMLRAQLDPHFLFNSLNGIASEIRARPDAAIEMVCRLSEYLRYSLEHRKQTFSPLSAELGAMRAYLEIERTRYGERLDFSIDASPAALASVVPSFLLQPLVENALKHNLMEARRQMALSICAQRSDGQLRIEVANTGALTHGPSADGGGLGLDTLARRLDLHYPNCHSFRLEQRGPMVYATLELWGMPCSA